MIFASIFCTPNSALNTPLPTMRPIFLLISTIILQGCYAPYVKPPVENRAYVELPTAQFITYMENGETCSDTKKFDTQTSPFASTDKTLIVPSGKRVAVTIGFLGRSKGCSVMLSFELPKDGRYRIKDSWNDNYCYVSLVKIKNGVEVDASDARVKQVKFVGLSNTCTVIHSPVNSSIKQDPQ